MAPRTLGALSCPFCPTRMEPRRPGLHPLIVRPSTRQRGGNPESTRVSCVSAQVRVPGPRGFLLRSPFAQREGREARAERYSERSRQEARWPREPGAAASRSAPGMRTAPSAARSPPSRALRAPEHRRGALPRGRRTPGRRSSALSKSAELATVWLENDLGRP